MDPELIGSCTSIASLTLRLRSGFRASKLTTNYPHACINYSYNMFGLFVWFRLPWKTGFCVAYFWRGEVVGETGRRRRWRVWEAEWRIGRWGSRRWFSITFWRREKPIPRLLPAVELPMNQMSMKRAVAPTPSLILEQNLDTLHLNSSTTTCFSFIVFPCNYLLSTGSQGSLGLQSSMLLKLVCNPVLLFSFNF